MYHKFVDVKICSCFGHLKVEITDELTRKTTAAIDGALWDGARIFLFGGRSNFDDLVYDLVTAKMATYPCIKRIFCYPLERNLRKPPVWYKPKEYEDKCCPPKSFDGWYESIYFRNCAMVDMSDFIVFYAEPRERSGAYKTYQYALKKRKNFVNLAHIATEQNVRTPHSFAVCGCMKCSWLYDPLKGGVPPIALCNDCGSQNCLPDDKLERNVCGDCGSHNISLLCPKCGGKIIVNPEFIKHSLF